MKLPHLKRISFAVIFILLLFFSCIRDEKRYTNTIFTENNIEVESNINFRTVASLYELNKKIIDIASISFNNSKQLESSKVLLKIKKDHEKIESQLKEIANENLIIIPQPFINLNLNETFLNEIDSNFYLISLLEKEIKNQIVLLDTIEKTSKDTQFITFADQSKDLLIVNNELLENIL